MGSTSTEHVLSHLGRTIKMALKTTGARTSVATRLFNGPAFPYRGMAHSRSIVSNRSVTGPKAWRKTDRESGPLRPIAEHGEWNSEYQNDPWQSEWDQHSYMNNPCMGSGSTFHPWLSAQTPSCRRPAGEIQIVVLRSPQACLTTISPNEAVVSSTGAPGRLGHLSETMEISWTMQTDRSIAMRNTCQILSWNLNPLDLTL